MIEPWKSPKGRGREKSLERRPRTISKGGIENFKKQWKPEYTMSEATGKVMKLSQCEILPRINWDKDWKVFTGLSYTGMSLVTLIFKKWLEACLKGKNYFTSKMTENNRLLSLWPSN